MLDSARLLFKRITRWRLLKIPTVTEKQLGLDAMTAKTIETRSVNGNVSRRELRIISKLVAEKAPYTIFEIGTFDGRTTINMARSAPAQARVYTLDLPKEDVTRTKFPLYSFGFSSDLKYVQGKSGERWKGKEGSEKIVQLYGDSAAFDYTPYLGKVDFVFIDGSHARDYVKNDTEVAFRLLGDQGTIVWHDYGMWEDVSDVLEEYFETDARFKDAKRIERTCFVILSMKEQIQP